MPWFIEQREGQYCVVKGTRDNPIETEKCHATEEAAKAHMAALYASEPEMEAEESKAVWDTAYVNNLPDSAFLYVESGGDKDDEGKTVPRSMRHFPYKNAEGAVDLPHLRNAIARIPQSNAPGLDKEALQKRARSLLAKETESKEDNMDEDEEMPKKSAESEDRFFVYKAADGTPRWAAISSVAVKDKEFEIVTEKAQDDAIQHANDTGQFGELDLVHVDGTDVGKCDMMARAGKRLVESGTWDDTDMARRVMKAVTENPDHWGISIKFVYDPSKFDGEKYHGNIRIRKRSILPQEMAASFGTRIVAMTGGEFMNKEMSKETRDALKQLGITEEEIEMLAEKRLTPDEPNTVEKQEVEPAETAEQEKKKPSVWERIKAMLSNIAIEDDDTVEPDADTGGVESEPEVTEPAEVQEKEVVPQMDAEMLKAFAEAVTAPLVAKLAEQGAEIDSLKARVAEAEGVVEDKILNKLIELPPVVKVRASQVEIASETPEPRGRVLPQTKPEADNYNAKLLEGVIAAVQGDIDAAMPKVKV